MVVEIPLTQGYVALVDDEDAERTLAAGPWRVCKNIQGEHVTFYAQAHGRDPLTGKLCGSVLMSRFILCPAPGEEVDHINHNGLDNRKSNLRRCNKAENQGNSCKHTRSSSQFKGVSLDTRRGKWRAQIMTNYHQIFLGYFLSEIDAARAYDLAARKHFGEFANLNLPGLANSAE